MFALEYNNLCWSTPGGFALEGICLRVPQGSFFGILGPDGCGKSALLRLTMDLLHPHDGTITVCGLDSVTQNAAVRRSCVYVPAEFSEDAAYGTRLRVREFLASAMSRRRKVDHSRIAELCQRFQLEPAERLTALDETERKRLVLIMGLLSDAPLVILDEPSLYLTRPERQTLFAELARMRENGSTIVFTTRSVSELTRCATHCALMFNGAILCGGETAELGILHTHRVTLTVEEDGDALLEELGVHNYTNTEAGLGFFYPGSMDRLVKTLAQYTVGALRVEDPTLESVLAAYHIMGGSEHGQAV